MKTISVDVAVIGAGTAGLAAYRAAVAGGRRAVLIEGGPYGTTCARVGCMPSKLLIAAAEAAHGPSRWAEFGLSLDGSVRIDGRAVMARVKRERDRFVGFVLDGVDAIPEADRILGHARFVDDTTLEVGDHTRMAFSRAVIATGSAPAIPAALREAGDRLIVNDDVFDWDDLPRSVAVFGPGVIGLELGQALSRLGVDVLMFGRNGHVGPFSDPTVRAYAARTFERELTLDTHADIRSIERERDGVVLHYRGHDGAERMAKVDYVIAATGRTPNIGALDLARTSLSLDERGVPLFDRNTMQCGGKPVFIAGDAGDDLPILHEAADEGRIAGENAARFPDVRSTERRTPFAIVFADPQLAVIGTRHQDLAPGSFVTGAVSFENQGRSRMMLRNRGLLHVYADMATGRLMGAEMIAPGAEHLAHLLAWAIQARFTVAQTLAMPFYHPVVEEGLRTALRDAHAKLAAAQVPAAA
ncbi:MAG: dihydrolipoyl dehydrogenase [Betaproteobacteria bacterium]